MLRGINRQQIFMDSEDNLKFLYILKDCKAISCFELYAYCLMGNHVHLLIKPTSEPLEQIFKRVGTRYVYWYNEKYGRTGHLFQDRFKSEPVDDEQYFLTVLRYIHRNPIRAKITNAISAYPWSSYSEYVDNKDIIDTAFAFGLMGEDNFTVFHKINDDTPCMEESETPTRINDGEAKALMREWFGCDTENGFQRLERIKQRESMVKMKANGMSIRQICRLTGVGKGIVERV
jgi:REP element-mobilizing transposase RayT